MPSFLPSTTRKVRVDQIPREENAQRWLVAGLWGDSSVGVIGGAPKCSKTWLGPDLALRTIGTPHLRRYAVPQPGLVLIYPANGVLTSAMICRQFVTCRVVGSI